MIETELHKLKFPIGEFQMPEFYNQDQINSWIESIEDFPLYVFRLCSKLSDSEKNWIYRPGGWSIKQVIHHCADSHMNALIRVKLALTEEKPVVKPYEENEWAELIDSLDDNIRDSINIISGVHNKWVKLLKTLNSEQYQREYIHPEHGKNFSIAQTVGMYAWHCDHHIEHIKLALESEGMFNTSNN